MDNQLDNWSAWQVLIEPALSKGYIRENVVRKHTLTWVPQFWGHKSWMTNMKFPFVNEWFKWCVKQRKQGGVRKGILMHALFLTLWSCFPVYLAEYSCEEPNIFRLNTTLCNKIYNNEFTPGFYFNLLIMTYLKLLSLCLDLMYRS